MCANTSDEFNLSPVHSTPTQSTLTFANLAVQTSPTDTYKCEMLRDYKVDKFLPVETIFRGRFLVHFGPSLIYAFSYSLTSVIERILAFGAPQRTPPFTLIHMAYPNTLNETLSFFLHEPIWVEIEIVMWSCFRQNGEFVLFRLEPR